MHQKIYEEFEKILEKNEVKGKVLEVGAMACNTLLSSKFLKKCDKIGINLDNEKEFDDIKFLKCNSNNMSIFSNKSFDCVLCNATLEHDKFFWKSISEMRRVLKKGGLLIIGTPSFHKYRFFDSSMKNNSEELFQDFLDNCTICLEIHDFPGDYYRFSEQTFSEVFFEDFREVCIKTIMLPPRTIGYGFKT